MMKRKKRFWAIAMTLIMCFGVTGVLSTDVKAAKTSEVQAQEEYPGDVIGTATINLVQSRAIGENGNMAMLKEMEQGCVNNRKSRRLCLN